MRRARNALLSLPFAALLAVAPALAAADVELRLTSGERAYGELIQDGEEIVVINRKVWTRNGLIVGRADFPRKRVAEITAVASLDALYQERAKASADTYEGQFQLARWCFERGLQDQAYTHARRLYDRDPSDEVTHQLLGEIGYVRDGEEWVKAADYAQKHGLVTYEGRMLKPEQVELRKAQLKADADRDALVAKQRSLESQVAGAERRVADAEARVAKAGEALAKTKAEEAEAKAAQKRAAEIAKTGNTRAAADSTRGMVVVNDLEDQVRALEGKQKDAQKSLASAGKELERAKAAAEANRQAVAAAEAALARADEAAKAGLGAGGEEASADRKPADAKAAAPEKPAETRPVKARAR